MSNPTNPNRIVRWLSEFSIPLIAGVVCALLLSNIAPDFYHRIVHTPITDAWSSADAHDTHVDHHAAEEVHASHTNVLAIDSHSPQTNTSKADSDNVHHAEQEHGGWSHYATLHFLINDVFMVFFFGIAAKEITEACLPNGALNPISKAINPLFATVGGILGPVAVYLGLNAFCGQAEWANGWGIPTATDIALAWLVARLIFGKGHPAISFLLLLAVADDAIGLGIIAIAYPDPHHPAQWANLLWIVPGIASVITFRKIGVKHWLPYILVGGAFSWWGLFSAHLHPALALVFIVPFLPGPKSDDGLYAERTQESSHSHSTLEQFEHDLRLFVDFGLFFFALANAGVSLTGITGLTWIVVASLLIGKTVGIVAFSGLASRVGFPLAQGMNFNHLIVTGVISGLGLTVALFVSGQAFADANLQDSAKMGAVLSAFAAILAYVVALALGVKTLPSLSKGWQIRLGQKQAT